MSNLTRNPLNKLKHNSKVIESRVIGRAGIIELLNLAILTNNHLLMIGPPGTAKSMLAHEAFKPMVDAKYFSIACTKRMSEEYLVGPLDMKLFRDKGEYLHRTEGTLVDCHFAFLDEFLDLPDQCARALLEVLNERTFTRGKQREVSTLQTAIAATNFEADTQALEAVEDRFMFRAKLKGINDNGQMLEVLNSIYSPEDKPKYRAMRLSEISVMQRRARTVRIHPSVLKDYTDFVCALRGAGVKITDRRFVRGIPVLKAIAYIGGRAYVAASDIFKINSCMIYTGDDKQEALYAGVCSSFVSTLQKRDKDLQSYDRIETAVFSISTELETARSMGDKDRLSALKAELTDLRSAIQNDTQLANNVYADSYVNTIKNLLAQV